jgi:uncharacterized protein YutE (UPF0331/DUF86 family)
VEIRFLANIIDQLDFALDHMALTDVNYKRLALMLIDNAMELALHRHAENGKQPDWRRDKQSPEYLKVLTEALGQRLEGKVRFARLTGLVSEEVAQTINTLHSYRNQLYHQGVMHEEILHALTVFYFRIVCDVMTGMPMHGYSWSSGHKIPHRAIKYIGNRPFGDVVKLFPSVWVRLKEVSEALPFSLVTDLHAEMTAVTDETERLLDFLVEADPGKRSRDEHIVDSQAWRIAFTEEGKRFASANACPEETIGNYVDWLGKNYKFDYRKDPVPGWRTRIGALAKEGDLHVALKKYQHFVNQTTFVREAIEASAVALDQEIERQIDAHREGHRS